MREPTVEERVLAALPELYAAAPIAEFPRRAIAVACRLIGGSKGEYTEVHLATGHFRVVVDPEPTVLSSMHDARRAHMHQHPVSRHLLRSGDTEARLISDFLTAREYRRLGLYGDFFARLGVEDQISALISESGAEWLAGVSVDRARRPFTDLDRRALVLLRPHLVAARANAILLSGALDRTAVDAARHRAAIESLTDRQIQVLEQIAAGLTNAQIALELDLSSGTVRKHVEHILRRLQLSTRTAAAACFISAGRVTASAVWTASESRLLAPLR